jgi:serine/threonine-protein kinase
MAQEPADRYSCAEDLALAAHDALTTSERYEAAALGRQGDNGTPLPDTSAAEPRTADAAAAQPHGSGFANVAPPRAWNPSAEGVRQSGVMPSSVCAPVPWTQTAAAHSGSGRSHPSAASNFDRTFLTARPRDKRKLWAVTGTVAVLVVVVIVVAGFLISRPPSPSQRASPPQQATKQTVLPFNVVSFRLSPGAVAVDDSGTVYVTNQGLYGRVVTLAAGSSTPIVEQFKGLYEPQGVAVDSAKAMYVTDFDNRVVKLPAGSSSQIELPFTGLNYPEGVAVDSAGSVYVADRGNNRVVKLPAGSTSQIVLPFDGLNNPDGVAVDDAGNVYVTDTDNNRAVKLDSWSNNQTVLSFPGLSAPWGIAVDNAGDVFVTERDTNTVMKLAAGSSAPTVLPFTDLNTPLSVTVDTAGNVYVANRGDDSVLKLAP